MITLVIPRFVPKSLNVLFTMHHMVRAKYKKEVEELVYWACKEQKIPPQRTPVKLQYELTFKNRRRRDYDNALGGVKFLNDGLVKAGVLPDDNSEVVTEMSVRFNQGKEEKTVITIT